MVPVVVAEKVPVVVEVMTVEMCTNPVPDACSKRPVPPVIVKGPLIWEVLAEVGQMVSCAVANSLSPLADMKVSCSIEVNPLWHDAKPVTVLMAANEVSPRCPIRPVPVTAAVVCDVKVKEPEKLALKGVEGVANTAGNVASTITARTAGIRTSLFILM